MAYLPAIEIEPASAADAAVIWLHGLGANGHDFEPIVPELQLPESMAIRFIFPHAPEIPVTINGGYVMPAWYDILEMSLERKVDVTQLMQSATAIQQLITREISRGIAPERIVLIGFSQGGAVAYEAGLSFEQPLAGLMGLSTYFATSATVQCRQDPARLPISVMHGTADPVVPESLGRDAVATLGTMGFSPSYQSYPMEHNVCMEQIGDISAWLQHVLPPVA